jgi:Pretoxin HINT domain
MGGDENYFGRPVITEGKTVGYIGADGLEVKIIGPTLLRNYWEAYPLDYQYRGNINGAIRALNMIAKEGMLTDEGASAKLLAKQTSSIVRKLCNCFVANTKIMTDKGEKPIEEIEVGDKVLSKNEETGELAYKEVTHLYRNEKEIIYELTVGDQVIKTTDNHPFWVEGKGWVLAADLHVGDKLQQSNVNTMTIASIIVVKHAELVKVYNFTVADFHTYFVRDLGIWVHNTGCDVLSPFDLVGRQTKDEMTGNKIKKIAKDMKQNVGMETQSKYI